ncbi:MAG: hypothetical protein ACFFDH_16205 [Promethearchaeota archaeon]
MKKTTLRAIICITVVNLFVISLLFVSNGYCASEEIDSKFGEAPVIDGYIDLSSNEWNKAVKLSTSLEDLDIEFWVIQDYSNLYISVQIELEIDAHNATEFIGILISNSSSENKEDFVDAKIVQFSDIFENNFTYLDYYINNSVFLPDIHYDGDGAAKLEGKTSIYEFSIPTKITNQEDVFLDYGNSYAFNITYGDKPSYPTGIIKSTIILINIKAISKTEEPLWNLVLFVLVIIIFSCLGILFGFYVYKIFKLKGKIERIKR